MRAAGCSGLPAWNCAIQALARKGLRVRPRTGNFRGPLDRVAARRNQNKKASLATMPHALHAVIPLRSPPAIDPGTPQPNLRDAVSRSVRRYLADLDSHRCDDLYRLVVAEVEGPLLDEVLTHCRGNQTRAAQMLGITRATLRKKLAALGRY
jgi:Fis family transcriptional regulator